MTRESKIERRASLVQRRQPLKIAREAADDDYVADAQS